ncbi:uncharacterized domain 1-containing protein [Loktanella sp. DSM 29012]|uniref:PaaI family thioesterase n=1 Tax=Loktanella sp. DSM 29012 TaxID=1881056 RepID=UPI0008BC03CD|nr:PaaI family thioesterase [Loktanella sp. DSM 29012]SEQ46420.1 uncharacterized domain 1-containing protein [Loktanella sp. DSM 29012]
MPLAKTFDELPSRETLLSLTGLEFMQAVLAGELSGPPISGIMNYHLHSVDHGSIVFHGTPDFAHTNPMGGIHGGWYGTLLDSAMACAVMTTVPRGSVYTTLEYKINITRAIPPGTPIIATGQIDHAGRSTGVATGRITDADGKLYATGSTTCLIMQIA